MPLSGIYPCLILHVARMWGKWFSDLWTVGPVIAFRKVDGVLIVFMKAIKCVIVVFFLANTFLLHLK